MIPTSFDESNAIIDKPKDMTREQCEPLNIWRGPFMIDNENFAASIISCWKLTKEELAEINRTGRIYLIVIGPGMPPVILSGHKPAFPSEE